MAKSKTVFFCGECGADSPKWAGKCSACGAWNSLKEEVVSVKSGPSGWTKTSPAEKSIPQNVRQITSEKTERVAMPDDELNLVLGGGLVPGSLVLLGGEPGIGKSTLLLQIALKLNLPVAYVSGEESAEQVKLRADRIGIDNEQCMVITETRLEAVLQSMQAIKPDIVVIDSIQTLYSDLLEATPGSVSQIRECAGQLLRFAKENQVSVFLIGHITKDGSIAGPKILEHMVDTVLQFEGDRNYHFRLLRTLKNRFGSTHEMGIYEMSGTGLSTVKNPSQVFRVERDEDISGVAIAVAMEGVRPILLETQSLVSTAVYGTPQRSCTGFDLRRLNMLLAVLEKRCGFRLGAQDVFINLAGGIRIEDPALDLAAVAAIMSSYQGICVPSKTVFSGEIGLSGEIRAVQRVEQRIAEAEKLGFEEIIVSKYCKIPQQKGKIKVRQFGRVDEMFSWLFG
ncbi:MAG: DNA repair protein RadA [Sphingomonadales bacterium]|nr:DNA repair protein RadA [Sphingomonadales bacterium]